MESNHEQVQKSMQESVAQRIGLWADVLRDCSALGLHFAENPYDRERYQRLQDTAIEMFAFASGQAISEIEPLRTTLFAHPAPYPCSDAAVIDTTGRILLIRRADNALWAMPGGALDVGETPAQGAVREVLEETGVSCEPITLVGVYDSRFCGTPSLQQLYQFSFLCRPLAGFDVINPPSHAHEVLEVKWFSEHNLPIDLDPGHIQRIPQAFRVWHGDTLAYFDH
ncbi:ADP-ribose pyrophosphatase [Dictyobacter vulcani]|uniref:ADP-ribose pyrophosphatase n=1 Tax=Dictyobacter vulcani TaxID=2607529 RepID=A0A5J4KEW4_9CHLR|nr:NUDIX hydrolase N-terminal domain-containing protein [Dictyobacter vulcani]GER86113.1 ADP-ribose pyrophosphatase [Dictyobacter vulcani]